MTTARATIKTALRKLRVVSEGDEPTAQQITDGLEVLNDMLHGLKARGADLEYQSIELTDDVPLPPEHIEPCKFLLAARLATEYGSELTPEVAVEAKDALLIFQGAYGRRAIALPDPALQNRISRYANSYNVALDQ